MKYLFILGRNPKLSVAEILSWLEARRFSVLSYYWKDELLLLELNKDVNCVEMINWLGGTLKIGKILASERQPGLLISLLNKIRIYDGESEKFFYSIMANCESDIQEYIKQRFKQEKLKATLKNIGYKVRQQDGEYGGVSPKSSLRLGAEYFLIFDGTEYNFGIINSVADTFGSEERDMSKPSRQSALGISPRLARILVNLSQVVDGKTLLDPFCGVGSVLLEALLNNVDVVGFDIDSSAIKNAEKNIGWVKNKYNIKAFSRLVCADSTKAKFDFDSVAFEPSFGMLLKKKPAREEAERIIREFEIVVCGVLKNISAQKNNAKVAFTMPVIASRSGMVKCDINFIIRETGFKLHIVNPKLVSFPVLETRENKIISREFVVLEN